MKPILDVFFALINKYIVSKRTIDRATEIVNDCDVDIEVKPQ